MQRRRGESCRLRTLRLSALIGALALVLAACSNTAEPERTATGPPGFCRLDEAYDAPPPAELNIYKIATGEKLYSQYCAACHGADLSGDPNWKTRNDDGTFPPPPHDTSGHTWHHPDELLLKIVRNGIESSPSEMPMFQGVLTDAETLSILEFFKSEWGDDERAFQWQVTRRGQQ